MSKCPPGSYRVRGPLVLPMGKEAGRAGALVYIDSGVETVNPAVIRALLKGAALSKYFQNELLE